MRLLKILIFMNFSLLVAACGGGAHVESLSNSSPEATADTTLSSPAASPELFNVTAEVFARSSWQLFPVSVNKDEQILISPSGSWTGGQKAQDLTTNLYCDADGCNGYSADPTNVAVVAAGFDSAMCGLPDGVAVLAANGGPYTPPTGNYGLCCSSQSRVIDVSNGQPSRVVKPNECLPIQKNILIMKIVPDGVDPSTITPVKVGTLYSKTPLKVQSSGRIYFRNNDVDLGISDNDGYLTVNVRQVN